MKTNTEKSIEFLNDCQDDYEELQEEGNNKGILEVIKLLEEGEKYKKIYDDLEEEYKTLPFSVASGTLLKMRQIKQKYFPKSKKTITIEIEGEDDINLHLAILMMKKAFDDIYCSPSMKFKVKRM